MRPLTFPVAAPVLISCISSADVWQRTYGEAGVGINNEGVASALTAVGAPGFPAVESAPPVEQATASNKTNPSGPARPTSGKRSGSESRYLGLVARKVVSMAEAIERFVPDGATVAMGVALEPLIPFAAGHELIRRRRHDLELVGPISDMLFDQLIGAG